MIDYISSVRTNNGLHIVRGMELNEIGEKNNRIIVKNIVADSGKVELVVANSDDEFMLRTIGLEKIEKIAE